MYQVKIFDSYSEGRFIQNDINEWLENNEIQIVDVKYQNWNENHPETVSGYQIFSAMIIYKED